MTRAIRLAMQGRGRVEPNPMVGCVLVKGERIIGEGFHEAFGGPHSEPNALRDCISSGNSPAGATAYISLEPCCHLDKKTPPCVPRLIEAKIARVVVGCLDPNPRVNGRGTAALGSAGIEVAGPCLGDEARQLIAPFLANVLSRRPYVTLKWAQSSDGKVAGPMGRPAPISNAASNRAVHELRAASDAIMIGINTAITDDPLLTARGVMDVRPCTRVILDHDLRLPITSRLTAAAGGDLIAVCSAEAVRETPERVRALEEAGVRVVTAATDRKSKRIWLATLIRSGALDLGTHLLVEPGPKLAQGFFQEGLADRVWLFRSSKAVEHVTAPAAAEVPGGYLITGETKIEDDRLTEYLNADSEVFFGRYPSADFQRVMRNGISCRSR